MAEQTKNNPNQNIDKAKAGQGSQAGGKNPPTGGPDLYKPTQPMEGEKKTGSQDPSGQGGQNLGQKVQGGQTARDPYPPTNPERPVMGGSPGGNVQGQKGGPTGGNVAGSTPGTIPAGGIAGTPGKPGVAPGLEEEEE